MNPGLRCRLAQKGSSLIELLLAASVSCGVVLAAIGALQIANHSFTDHEQHALLLENGNYALGLIAQALRQTAYVDHSEAIGERYRPPENGSLWGADARSVKSGDFGKAALETRAINGSDVLVIHFPGAGIATNAGVTNCAGFIVERARPAADRGWSIFYVAKSSLGEPELRCKYKGNAEWEAQAIVSGVESFQVLYGIDTDGDGIINQYLNASAIDKLDADGGMISSHWSEVLAVRVGLLLCSPNRKNTNKLSETFDLFGFDYAHAHGSTDAGTRLSRSNLAADSRNWYRQVVQSIIYLPNVRRASST